jgi:cytochrome b561
VNETHAFIGFLVFLLLVFMICMAAITDGWRRQERNIDRIERMHQRTLEAAKQMHWPDGPADDRPAGGKAE